MSEQTLHRGSGIVHERIHLGGRISLSHDHNVDPLIFPDIAVKALPSLPYPFVRRRGIPDRADKYVGRIHFVDEAARDPAEEIEEAHGHLGFPGWHGNEEYVLERPPYLRGFFCCLPFLEQRRERHHVLYLVVLLRTGRFRTNLHLPVSLERNTVQVIPPPCPTIDGTEPCKRYLLFSSRSAEDIVETQGLARRICPVLWKDGSQDEYGREES